MSTQFDLSNQNDFNKNLDKTSSTHFIVGSNANEALDTITLSVGAGATDSDNFMRYAAGRVNLKHIGGTWFEPADSSAGAPSHALSSATHTGDLAYTQIDAIVGTGASTVAAGNHNHTGTYAPNSHALNGANHSGDLAYTQIDSIVGTGASTVAAGNHLHTGVYEPAGSYAADPHALSGASHSGDLVYSQIDAIVGTSSSTVARGDHTHSGIGGGMVRTHQSGGLGYASTYTWDIPNYGAAHGYSSAEGSASIRAAAVGGGGDWGYDCQISSIDRTWNSSNDCRVVVSISRSGDATGGGDDTVAVSIVISFNV